MGDHTGAMPNNSRLLLSLADAAARLGKAESTMRVMRSENRLPVVKGYVEGADPRTRIGIPAEYIDSMVEHRSRFEPRNSYIDCPKEDKDMTKALAARWARRA